MNLQPWLRFHSSDVVVGADRAEIGLRAPGRGLKAKPAPAKLRSRVLPWGVPGVFGASIIAQRASRGGAPTAPRTRPRRAPRLGRKPKPKAPQSVAPVPLLPPLSDSVWKPTPVAEEEVLQATEVNGQSSLKDVAAEACLGTALQWGFQVQNMIAKERVLTVSTDEAATLRERRRLLRDAARRLFVRVQCSGELCLEGGPALGYVPVMYGGSPGPLVFRANDVTALNVAWQFFLNGLSYSFLSHKLHPFFGVYFTLSPTEHFQLLRDWLKTWNHSSQCRVLDLGTGSGVISFLVHQLCPDTEIVASDRCPNAVFSVGAELRRQATSTCSTSRIRVKRSDLFEELKEEAPFDLIIFNPPWVPEPPERSATPATGAEADVVFGNDYPPELFPRLFAEVLQPDGHLLVLFSNYAQCRGLVERSPMEDGLRSAAAFGRRLTGNFEAQAGPYFARRVVEAGELCCKHWLAVQIARQCGMGIAMTTLMQEDEFVEWSQKRLVGTESTEDCG
eukprot:s2296_g5.t3